VDLCSALASGYLRTVTGFLAARDEETGLLDCAPALATNEDAVAFVVGDAQAQIDGLCGPNGIIRALVNQMQAAQQGGRAVFSQSAADACTQAGRALFANGGLTRLDLLSPDAGAGVVQDCLDALIGLQGEGDPCSVDFECTQGAGGAQCVLPSGVNCEGTCRPMVAAGQPCRGNTADCQDGLSCIGDVCEAPRAVGAACRTDAGQQLPCEDGARCASGLCVGPSADGGMCASSSDCADGLWCANSVCVPRRGEGGDCSAANLFDAVCQPCLGCFRRTVTAGQDAGPPVCTTYASQGESCLTSPCHRGLACSAGQCVTLARHGAPCVAIDGADETVRGNCLLASDSCIGSPRTCTARATEGQACTSPTGSRAFTGSCRQEAVTGTGELVCVRALATDSVGTCQSGAAPGAPCGFVHNLPGECQEVTGAGTDCSVYSDGGRGLCTFTSNGPEGGTCRSDFSCLQGHYCNFPVDSGVLNPPLGTCERGGVLNARCGSGEPWETTCMEGECRPTPDAGNVLRCLDFYARGAVCPRDSTVCGPEQTCVLPNRLATEGTCQPRAAVGEACTGTGDCAPGAVCDDGFCASQVCQEQASSGCSGGGAVPLLLLFGAVTFRGARRRR